MLSRPFNPDPYEYYDNDEGLYLGWAHRGNYCLQAHKSKEEALTCPKRLYEINNRC